MSPTTSSLPPRLLNEPAKGYPHETARARAAAYHALKRYPGPVGELLCREISAYADFGYRTDGTGLVPRAIDELMRPPEQ